MHKGSRDILVTGGLFCFCLLRVHRSHLDPFERDRLLYTWRHSFDHLNFNLKRFIRGDNQRISWAPSSDWYTTRLRNHRPLIYSKDKFIYLFLFFCFVFFLYMVHLQVNQPISRPVERRHSFGGLTDKPAEHKRKAVTAFYYSPCAAGRMDSSSSPPALLLALWPLVLVRKPPDPMHRNGSTFHNSTGRDEYKNNTHTTAGPANISWCVRSRGKG